MKTTYLLYTVGIYSSVVKSVKLQLFFCRFAQQKKEKFKKARSDNAMANMTRVTQACIQY